MFLVLLGNSTLAWEKKNRRAELLKGLDTSAWQKQNVDI